MSTAEILQLPLREKLQIMEAIWEDLRKQAESFEIPQSQKDLLDSGRNQVSSGEAKILDWDQVKDSIGRA
ncbi:MAG: addiction module protein [Chthoniobacteraceae bacterium]